MKRIVATLSLLIVFILVGISPAFSAPSFANDKFKTLWSYSDKLVDEIPGAGRGFTWGPNSFGSPIEDYQEGAGGTTNPTPTPTPTPITTNPPSTGVTFLQVTGGTPGANAYVKVQTAANASCSISYVTPIGNPSNAQGLVSKSADGSGVVDWTWKISPNTTPGTGTVTVTCNGVSASTGITIG